MSKTVRAVAVGLLLLIVASTLVAQGKNTKITPTHIVPSPQPFHPGENISVATDFAAKGAPPGPIVKDTSLELQVFMADASGDIAPGAKPIVVKTKPYAMPSPGTPLKESFDAFPAPALNGTLHGKTKLIMRLVYRGVLVVRVPPGEGGKDNFRRDPFMTVIGAETFPMHCGKAGPATCRYQTDAMWLAEAKAHAQSGTSH